MKAAHHVLTALTASFVATVLLAQQPPDPSGPQQPTTAEQLFRDAWWAESGANDAGAALRGYLDAAAASGPAAVRARALLFAGRLQQRLGEPDAALASFRRVVTEFATETQAVAEARAHLRELTAVDLRQNYDEWYERRLFSEEVQLTILGKLEAIAGLAAVQPGNPKLAEERRQQLATLTAELLAFGKGAVPALRKAAAGANAALAARAISMLFALGEVPPLDALLASSEWWSDSDAVRTLCTSRAAPRPAATGQGAVFVDTDRDGIPDARQASPAGSWQARALAAALQGPEALAMAIVGDVIPDEQAVSSMSAAVMGAPQARATLLAALPRSDVPLLVRIAIEDALAQHELDPPPSPAEWLAVGEQPLRAELRAVAVRRAATQLGGQDGAALERLLQWVGEDGNGVSLGLYEQLLNGLSENRAPELAPWTPARLAQLLRIVGGADPGNAAASFWARLRRAASFRHVLALAVLDDPVALVGAFRRDGDDQAVADNLATHFAGDLDSEQDGQLMARRWHRQLADVLPPAWERFDDAAKLATLLVLRGVRHPLDHAAPPIRDFLDAKADGESAPVRAAIEQTLAAFVG